MGLFDSFKNVFGKQGSGTVKNPLITISYSLLPVRLKSYSSEKTALKIDINYLGEKPSICSLTISLQSGLSFDTTNLNRKKEIRLGLIEPGDKKSQEFDVYSTVTTPPGDYKITISSNVHDGNYNQVLRSFEKSFELRVV